MKVPNLILATVFYAASLLAIDSTNALAGQRRSHTASKTTPINSTATTMMNDEDLFQQVPLDTNEQTVCSPADPGIDWRGVVIRAPSSVVLPEKTSQFSALVIPICGLYLVDVADTFRHPGPRMLIIVDSTSGQTYKAALVKRVPEPTIPPPPTPPISPSTKAAFGDYFNVNAAAYVALPMQVARYRVKVEYAGYQSNEVIIETVEHP